MSPATRPLPWVGQSVEVLDLAHREPGQITRVAGTTVWVRIGSAPDDVAFDLHPISAHFVQRGQPYWGTRLRLDDAL